MRFTISSCLILAPLLLNFFPGPALAGDKKDSGEAFARVLGFERFHAKNPDAAGGRLLLGELGCVQCHAASPEVSAHLIPRQAPILDAVGMRVQRDYLRKFISDPQAIKPGTPMPSLVAGLADKEKEPIVEALVHFLSSTGTVAQERFDRKSIVVGTELYAKVGCVACHGPRNAAGEQVKVVAKEREDDTPAASAGFVLLGDLKAKYSLNGLSTFLANPLHVRPSARMPSLLDAKQARDVANYLLQGQAVGTFASNVKYAYFEGTWAKVPNFKKLKPHATGEAYGLDLSLALRGTEFAMSFDGYLKIDRDGDYRFHLMSDDGSKLSIDDKVVVNNDGVHPPTSAAAAARLTAGTHKFHVGFFQVGGGAELSLEIEGPNLPRQPIAPFLLLTPQGNPKAKDEKKSDNFTLQPELVAKGKELFASLGCASCHTVTVAKTPLASTLKSPALDKLAGQGGCLSPQAKQGVPQFRLSPKQQTALTAAIKAPAPAGPPTASQKVGQTLQAFNCYACHQRDKVGGVEEDLNGYFTGTQQDLADEGRLPPLLTGVGAKLNPGYLKDILDKGSHDRTYMDTRMPSFGDANVGHLVALFAELDKLPAVPEPEFKQPITKVKAEARHMVGALGLGCIKCHTFAGNKAEGVQGMDMTIMTARVKRDWFHQYLLNPSKFRPGTRMPTAWPDGVSLLPKILEGSTPKQIEAVWLYLSDGKKAQVPLGMNSKLIVLSPDHEAIIFRNFLSGAGPRAIAVGYPERAHLSFDANDLRIATIWQGAFMNAGRHWTNRGEGFEPPLGDNIVNLPPGVSFAFLEKETDPWPTKSAREAGIYHFLGYKLTKDQRPTFMYSVGDVRVDDFPNAVRDKAGVSLVRTLTMTCDKGQPAGLYFRAAAASKIEPMGDGWYRAGELKIRIQAAGTPSLRTSAGHMELLVPVQFKDGRASIVQEFAW